jgi:hypothetical protein
MRKITKESVYAFINDLPFNKDNTRVFLDRNFNNPLTQLYLHGNLIAQKCLRSGVISITNCGWFTNTTKERLNGLPNVLVYQRKGKWFLNGAEWDGEWVEVKG